MLSNFRQPICHIWFSAMKVKSCILYEINAGKRDQIDKKFFFEITSNLDQMTKFTSILLRNFFFKKKSIWSFFPALTPHSNNHMAYASVGPRLFIIKVTVKNWALLIDFTLL